MASSSLPETETQKISFRENRREEFLEKQINQIGKRMTEGELFNLICSVAESVHGEKRLRVEAKKTPA